MKNNDNTQLSSSVGSVVDVATPSTRKLRLLGFVWALTTLFPLAIINYAIFDAITSDDGLLSTGHPLHLIGLALMPFLTWFSLGSAIQRFQAASNEERYFRVGPGGVSVSLPDDGAGATFSFSSRSVNFDLPWDQVKTWYPYIQSMNFITTERSIVFETLKGEKVKIKTYHFAEKQKEIAERIDRARSLPASIVEQPNVTEDATEKPVSLPPGLAEASFQIKKKRDTLKELDLRSVPGAQRINCIEKIANVLEAKIVSLCPTASGFRYSRKYYRPFEERKDIPGIRLFVQHGLLSGYEIQVEPNDSECRKLTISMCGSSLIADISKYVSIAVGVVCLVISFQWLAAIQDWLGEFSRLSPLVVLAIGLGAMAACMGLLKAPISLLRQVASDKEKDEIRKQQIRMGVQEVAIGALVQLA